MDIETLNATIVACRKCPRLVEYRQLVASKKKKVYQDWEYWGRPVPAFGDSNGRVLVVGLAPGPHGSNRTGRMFTGDSSGVFLYAALNRAGFANQPTSTSRDDGLQVADMLISAVCRCVPPDNKPSRSEIENCLPYLEQEIRLMKNLHVTVALGRIGFDNVLKVYRGWGYQVPRCEFKHSGVDKLGDDLPWLVASYHPSQQNTQTGRLTVAMFDSVWQKVKQLLK
jgi:uracil-DNA glycosylase family 4